VDGELERRSARLRQGDHLCLIYHSAAEQTAALVAFLKAGLAAGERCLFVGHATSGRRLENALEAAGIDVGPECERGALLLLTRRKDWLPQGGFDPGSMLDLLRQAEQQALDDGFSGLRATWNMCWLLEGAAGADRLLEYEALLNRFLSGSRTCALCRYSPEACAADTIQEALHTHPLCIIGDQICSNAFYEPPDMVLGDRSPEERIDWMMAQLWRNRLNEQKLEDVTVRLAQKRTALARANQAKEDLLGMLAHELRNPLGTISNALQVLRMGDGDETRKRAIAAAERQVLHQAMLIDDLLEASRVTRGEIELECESLDLAELVRETAEGYRETLKHDGRRLELALSDEPLRVRGDRLRISQALSNLLDNAAKFTQAGGRVTVRAARTAGGRRAEVSVHDDGAGIEPEVLPHVFEVFTQGDHSLDRSLGGLGVGLAVVKGLIEMHGGEVEARSAGPGKGSEIVFRIPLENAAAAAERQPAMAHGGRKVLVVEDNPDAGAMMRDFLELSGHEVELAATGTDGVEAARQFHPEVVLCDLGLPGMSGYEVAEELRRDPSTRSAKLIAVTGYGRDEDRRRSKAAGFDIHLTKPVDPVKLRALLEERPGGRTH
jgi:signal transduction histidine kinase/ActR/RegA family two-component response regulator